MGNHGSLGSFEPKNSIYRVHVHLREGLSRQPGIPAQAPSRKWWVRDTGGVKSTPPPPKFKPHPSTSSWKCSLSDIYSSSKAYFILKLYTKRRGEVWGGLLRGVGVVVCVCVWGGGGGGARCVYKIVHFVRKLGCRTHKSIYIVKFV